MTETNFLHSNKQRWSGFEDIINGKKKATPDSLASVFLQLTDDLAYAKTHFPQGEVTQYLNNLTISFHTKVYKNKREKTNRFAKFWLEEVPLLYFENRRFVGYSLIFFLLGILVGVVSSANDATYLRLIMGDGYVDMTLNNIENGDPMGVYKSMGQAEMFFYITFNNVRVSLVAFAAGLLFSVGTAVLLVQNAIMLGAFQFFFYQKGLLLTSFLTIWIHGTLEISAIVLAGGAGLAMGNRLLFPKTYGRLTALKKGAKDGVKMVIGLVPIFIIAGFLESYVTRLTELPSFVKLAIIGSSAFFILFYFVWYPKIIANTKLLQNQAHVQPKN